MTSGPIRVKAEAVRVAASQFLSINTLTMLAPCSHKSSDSHECYMYETRALN